jgi:hypothetical protein
LEEIAASYLLGGAAARLLPHQLMPAFASVEQPDDLGAKADVASGREYSPLGCIEKMAHPLILCDLHGNYAS